MLVLVLVFVFIKNNVLSLENIIDVSLFEMFILEILLSCQACGIDIRLFRVLDVLPMEINNILLKILIMNIKWIDKCYDGYNSIKVSQPGQFVLLCFLSRL